MYKTFEKDKPSPPYVGLTPFEKENYRYFFGREKDIQIAAMNLRAANITIFYGASGVGKTSLINAGVLPYLQNVAELSILPDKMPEFILVVLRDWVNDDEIDSLRRVVETAVFNAYDRVSEKTKEEKKELPLTKEEIKKAIAVKQEEIKKETAENSNKDDLYILLKSWTDLLKINFLIVFDQFEVFLAKAESNPKIKTDESSFVLQLSKIINSNNLPVNFMISLRDDALAQLDFLKNKTPGLMKNTLRLEHLNFDGASAAIIEPLGQYNKENKTGYYIEPDLVKRLLKELRVGNINFDTGADNTISQPESGKSADNTAGQTKPNNLADRIETPFLQLVMERLWKEVEGKEGKENQLINDTTLDALKSDDEPNPVRNIIKTYFDYVMNRFSKEQRVAASEFIHFTVSTGGAKRSSSIEELRDYTKPKVNEDEIRTIMETLAAGNKRVFKDVRNRTNKTTYYEVTHDALVPAILNWRKREHEKGEAEKLKSEQTAERRAKIKRIFLYGSSIAVVLIMAVASWIILRNLKQAEEYRKKQDANIEYQRLQNETVQKLNEKVQKLNKQYASLIPVLLNLQSDNSDQAKKALDELRKMSVNKEIPEEYKSFTDDILDDKGNNSEQNPQTRKKIVIEAANKVNIAQQNIAPPQNSSQAIIYIQFQNDDDRPKAVKLRSLLNNQNGFLAPGIENVSENTGIRSIQVRCFRDNDCNNERNSPLNNVIVFLNGIGIKAVPFPVKGYENSPLIRPNQFELWFTGDGIPDFNATPNGKDSTTAN